MQFTIGTYNIHSGKDIIYRATLHKMMEFIKSLSVDILALQEVQNNSKNGWHFNELQQYLVHEGVYGGNIKLADGQYGNATFSAFPIIESENVSLTSSKEQRGALCTTIQIGEHRVRILNTHLGLGRRERSQQMNEVNQLLMNTSFPNLLVGDLNTTAPLLFTDMVDLAKKIGKEGVPTIFPLKKRIDYILASKSIELMDYEVIPVTFSDHYPVKATVRLRQ